MGASQISYVPALWDIANSGFKPNKVLELGCGCSSFMLRWLFEKSKLHIIDDNSIWFNCTENMGGYSADFRKLARTKQDFLDGILQFGKMDLIFVDCGRRGDYSDKWRSDFLKLIREKKILNPEGLIILHDATRPEYQEECKNWECDKKKEEDTYILKWPLNQK